MCIRDSGHAIQVGGVIVDSGNFNWENGKFGELCTPDESYHGVTSVSYTHLDVYKRQLE